MEPMTEHLPAGELVIGQRYRGPATSGNGGWSAGALARLLHERITPGTQHTWPPTTVTLRQPPPLDTTLELDWPAADHVVASRDGATVLEATVGGDVPEPLAPVTPEQARTAEASYAGLREHPFPTCFVCGTGREPGDGLRIFPGPVAGDPEGDRRVAATWTPVDAMAEDWHEYDDAQRCASLAVAWAALDCPGAWSADIEARPLVLGRMSAAVDALPRVGEEHVVVGRLLETDGRKNFAATTLYDADERVVARAHQVWIEIDPSRFG